MLEFGIWRFLTGAFHLFARDRSYIGNFPAHVRECFYGRDDPDNEKCDLDERRDYRPEKHQDAADAGDRSKDHVHDGRGDIKQKPRATKNNRLHGIKTHKAVMLFQNIKNDAADQRYAGNRGSHVRR